MQKGRFSYLNAFIFINILISFPACMTFKTVSLNSLNEMQGKRDMIRIHSDTLVWAIERYEIDDDSIKGTLATERLNDTPVSRLIDIYVAPMEAVKISGNTVAVSRNDIGKSDYPANDNLQLLSGILAVFIFLTCLPALM